MSDMLQAFEASGKAKTLKKNFETISKECIQINCYQEYLKLERTNFSEIQDEMKDLIKYEKFWEFTENWKY